MTIASSSGLSEKDIEKMVSEAEQYAETDKERRSLIEEANKADSVCFDTEKGEILVYHSKGPCVKNNSRQL
jgi:molecular chaperone DnaK